MLNRFWPLSKNPFTTHPPLLSLPPPPPILNGQYQAPWNTNHNLLEKGLLWKVMRYSYQFFYFLFYISSYISRYHLYNFREFHSTLSEKNLRPKFSFLNGFTNFTNFFFHHQWNHGRLLLINMVYMSFLTSCQTT